MHSVRTSAQDQQMYFHRKRGPISLCVSAIWPGDFSVRCMHPEKQITYSRLISRGSHRPRWQPRKCNRWFSFPDSPLPPLLFFPSFPSIPALFAIRARFRSHVILLRKDPGPRPAWTPLLRSWSISKEDASAVEPITIPEAHWTGEGDMCNPLVSGRDLLWLRQRFRIGVGTRDRWFTSESIWSDKKDFDKDWSSSRMIGRLRNAIGSGLCGVEKKGTVGLRRELREELPRWENDRAVLENCFDMR